MLKILNILSVNFLKIPLVHKAIVNTCKMYTIMNMLNILKKINCRSFQCFKIEAMHPSVTHPIHNGVGSGVIVGGGKRGLIIRLASDARKTDPKKSDGSNRTLQIRVSWVNSVPL